MLANSTDMVPVSRARGGRGEVSVAESRLACNARRSVFVLAALGLFFAAPRESGPSALAAETAWRSVPLAAPGTPAATRSGLVACCASGSCVAESSHSFQRFTSGPALASPSPTVAAAESIECGGAASPLPWSGPQRVTHSVVVRHGRRGWPFPLLRRLLRPANESLHFRHVVRRGL